MPGYSISIFLPDGAPTGLRIAKRSHWTGEVLMCPRTLYPSVSGREAFGRTGVYVLVGQSDDGTDTGRVYVGEGDNVRTRLKSHFDNKDFWNDVVVITKTDSSLNKADVRYLEARLVELAKKSPTVTVDNGTNPGPPEPVEAHKADLDSFLIDTLAILRLLGITAFSSDNGHVLLKKDGQKSDTGHGWSAESSTVFYFQTKKASGEMSISQEGFLLHAGDGIARTEQASLSNAVRSVRQKLLGNGTLQEIKGDTGHLRLTANVPFNSPSAAAMFVCAASINGRIHWKDASGKSIAEREAEEVAGTGD